MIHRGTAHVGVCLAHRELLLSLHLVLGSTLEDDY